ncbi:hypothetical protein F4678DRAFT_453654 [Xylaria arbuscula]|nr:hypothetical protein F4678DRAFT_453654 [Xylaria arbuscula]
MCISGALGYIAPSTGFGCDSVIEFEVALANGSVVIANSASNSDLWRALRGGGSNFGIVTKLVMNTTALGDIWAGEALYEPSALDAQIQAFYSFASNPNYDDKADLLMSFLYTGQGGLQIADLLTYGEPEENPAAFDAFYAIDGQILNSTTVTNVPDFSIVQEETSPDGLQQITLATMFTNNAQHLKDVFSIFNESIAGVSNIDGISWALTFEPLVTSFAAASNARGGNILGLTIPSEGLVLTLGSFSFNSAADYAEMNNLVDQLLADLIAAAVKNNVFNPFVELNHAKQSQKPFPSYGAEQYAFLLETANKYDPNGVFQTLMPGGFKLQ